MLTVHTDKITRCLPCVSRCEQRKLAIVRGGWNKDFLDELAAFPETKHDDQIDAVSGGFTLLSSPTGAITDPKQILLGTSGASRINGFVPRTYVSPRQLSQFDNRSPEQKLAAIADAYKSRFG